MMVALITWLTGSRWALAAAKWGAVALTVLLFLLRPARRRARWADGRAPGDDGEVV